MGDAPGAHLAYPWARPGIVCERRDDLVTVPSRAGCADLPEVRVQERCDLRRIASRPRIEQPALQSHHVLQRGVHDQPSCGRPPAWSCAPAAVSNTSRADSTRPSRTVFHSVMRNVVAPCGVRASRSLPARALRYCATTVQAACSDMGSP